MGFLSLRFRLQRAAAALAWRAGTRMCCLCLLDSGGEWNPTEGLELLQVGKTWAPAPKERAKERAKKRPKWQQGAPLAAFVQSWRYMTAIVPFSPWIAISANWHLPSACWKMHTAISQTLTIFSGIGPPIRSA